MADSANTTSKRPGPATEQLPNPLGESSSGWIACTTDSILAIKDDLWDVLITMPATHTINAREKVWPTVESPKGRPMQATQRDLRRFRTLKNGLRRLTTATSSAVADDNDTDTHDASNDTQRPLPALPKRQSRLSMSSMHATNFLPDGEDTHTLADASEKIVEPMTWAALAYSGFMWWASAGEQRRSDEGEEAAHDNGLLADLIPAPSPSAQPQQRRASGSFNVTGSMGIGGGGGGGMNDSITSLTARRATAGDGGLFISQNGDDDVDASDEEDRARRELGIITYFHRLTAGVLGTLAEVVAAAEEDYTDLDVSRTQSEDEHEESEQLLRQNGEGDGEDVDGRPEVRVDSEALAAMGLDVWSPADADFVREAVARYFNRRARVEGKGVEVCGMRVC